MDVKILRSESLLLSPGFLKYLRRRTFLYAVSFVHHTGCCCRSWIGVGGGKRAVNVLDSGILWIEGRI
jgi:hypothetical protein